jgi:tetrahydromethanopterin S-methyltransferase subunit E
MDLWAMLGVSRGAGIAAAVVGLVALVGLAGRLFRRSRRQQRVWVDLSGRG